MEITGMTQWQAWQDRVLPPVEKVRPGLWSIPVPIPNNPLRYVLVYAFELDDGVAIVDAGWDTPEAWHALTQGLITAGASVADVRAVLVTHIHPDHYGLAGRVREESGAWVALHHADAALLTDRYRNFDGLIRVMHDQLVSNGVPDLDADTLANASRDVRTFVRHAEPDRLLDDGEVVPLAGLRLRTVWTPGHSPGHVCFVDDERRLLLSGDHVLPRITPMVAANPQAGSSPLADFLDSLAKVRELDPEIDEVLPAHEYRFRGLADRVDVMTAHHTDRLAELARHVAEEGPAPAWDLARGLTWSRPWTEIASFMRRGAMLETLAHLTVLADQGVVTSTGTRPVLWSAVESGTAS